MNQQPSEWNEIAEWDEDDGEEPMYAGNDSVLQESKCDASDDKDRECGGLIEWNRDQLGECHGNMMYEVIGKCKVCGAVYLMN